MITLNPLSRETGAEQFQQGRSYIRECRSSHSVVIASLLSLAQLAPASLALAGSDWIAPVLNPKTYQSPSRRYELSVNPSSRQGSGTADYEVSYDSTVVWAASRPFTLWDATITNDGRVVGYSYTQGLSGNQGVGELILVIVAPDGKDILTVHHPRTSNAFLQPPSIPFVLGVHIQATLNRATFRIRDYTTDGPVEHWWSYDLVSGRALEPIDIRSTLSGQGVLVAESMAAYEVVGSSLTVAWFASTPLFFGGTFCLLDEGGTVCWSLDLADDYIEEGALGNLKVCEALLPQRERGRFAIWHYARRERIDYEVSALPHDNKYKVVEIGREVLEPPRVATPEPFPQMHPVFNCIVPLGGMSAATEDRFKHMVAYSLNSTGMQYVSAVEHTAEYQVVQLDGNGKTVERQFVRFPTANIEALHWFPLAAHTWLVSSFPLLPGRTMPIWRYSSIGNALEALEDIDCWWISAVCELSEGRIVILGYRLEGSTVSQVLMCIGPDGKELWTLGALPTEGECLPEGIAVVSGNRIVGFDADQSRLYFISDEGHCDAVVPLADSLGQVLSHSAQLMASVGGELVLVDLTPSQVQLWWIDLDSNEIARTTVDKELRGWLSNRFRASPEGGIWAYDGLHFLEFNREGALIHKVSQQSDAGRSGRVARAAIDSLRRLCLQAENTGRVHVYNLEGEFLYSCAPPSSHSTSRAPYSGFSVDGSGKVYIAKALRHDMFAPGGAYLGSINLGSSLVFFDPTDDRRWIVRRLARGVDIVLENSHGEVIRLVSRRSDNQWLDGKPALAPDGRLCVVGRRSVDIYSRDGESLGGWTVDGELPTAQVAIAGDWIVASDLGRHVVLIRISDRTARRFSPPSRISGRWHFGFCPSGTELLGIPLESPAIYRWLLPD